MNPLACFLFAYFCIGLLIATVVGGNFIVTEYKQGKLRNLYVKKFVGMMAALLLMWPLLFIGVLGD